MPQLLTQCERNFKMCITSHREDEIPLLSYQEDKGVGK